MSSNTKSEMSWMIFIIWHIRKAVFILLGIAKNSDPGQSPAPEVDPAHHLKEQAIGPECILGTKLLRD